MPLPETIRILNAAAEPSRLRILAALRARRMCVCELCAALGLKQSVMSQHLRVLRDAGLVLDSKNGLWVDYELTAAARKAKVLKAILAEAAQDQAIVADRRAAAKADRAVLCGPGKRG
ncbi:MAG: winged helix-turn-helix transcriptional regulator [Elusimicrobia bacterium]|nr:winged helix-turn-helix transcriptional regulator [Elusimicrobiota bacterium]